MKDITLFGFTISAWLYAPIAYFLWVSILLVLKKIIFEKVEKFAAKTKSKIDDILLGALNTPLMLLIFVSGALALDSMFTFDRGHVLIKYLVAAFKVTLVIAVIIFLDKLLRNLIKVYAAKVDALKTSGGVAQGFVRAIVIGIGLLILLESMGISITPIIASLGIGSLAIALALQPTLENFFAGIQLVIDKPIQVGHYIQLDSGEKGYVDKIGWRSTWIKMLPNNIVVIPNKILVNSKVLNYYYPSQDMAVLVQVGVHYKSDLKHVEKVTIEVGEEIMKETTGGVPEFKPFIRYHTFDDFSINFTVILRCKEFVDNYLITHEFIKKLHERYNKEGINIPYPIRAINYAQEGAK